MIKRKSKVLAAACVAVLAGMLAGCADSPSTQGPSGNVLQGPVEGAFVFADENGNFKYDSGEPRGTTNGAGKYTLNGTPTPANSKIISIGGTDTTTSKAATFLVAPAGSGVITPLTTLVALSDDPEAMKTKIQAAIGVPFDADITTTKTSAVLFVKAIETSMAGLTELIVKGDADVNPKKDHALALVQKDVLKAIADAVLAEPVNANLITPNALQTVLQTGMEDGLAVASSATYSSADNSGTSYSLTIPVLDAAGQATSVVTAAVNATTTVLGVAPGAPAPATVVNEESFGSGLADAIDDIKNDLPAIPVESIVTPATGGTGGTGTGSGGTQG